jgi:hypothetical protein
MIGAPGAIGTVLSGRAAPRRTRLVLPSSWRLPLEVEHDALAPLGLLHRSYASAH